MSRPIVPGSLVCHVEVPFVITVAEEFQSMWVFETGLSVPTFTVKAKLELIGII